MGVKLSRRRTIVGRHAGHHSAHLATIHLVVYDTPAKGNWRRHDRAVVETQRHNGLSGMGALAVRPRDYAKRDTA